MPLSSLPERCIVAMCDNDVGLVSERRSDGEHEQEAQRPHRHNEGDEAMSPWHVSHFYCPLKVVASSHIWVPNMLPLLLAVSPAQQATHL